MFSVMHINPNHSAEVRSCDFVEHLYHTPSGKDKECVALHMGHEVYWLWDGIVYVMNENGRTVATWTLTGLDEKIPTQHTIAAA